MKDYCRILPGLLLLLIGLAVWVNGAAATVLGDECDWTGSASSSSSSARGVTPVYLRCTAGRVTWLYPKGALRVLLRLPAQDREFRACIKLHHEEDGGRNFPARLFLEGPRSLLPLFANEDGGSKVTRCFNSKNGQVAIYVEANDDENVVQRRVADFEYDLEQFPRGSHSFDPSEECRPCTSQELAHAFCTSDLVTRGIIRGVENRDELELSQMIIRITKLIRHTVDDDDDISSNAIERVDDAEEVVLNVPQRCGVSHGLGEFVFMARRKLGELTLRCAPRLEDWAVLVHRLTEEGKNHCILRS